MIALRSLPRALIVALAAAGLAGCATFPGPRAPDAVPAFERALAEGYRRLADDEFAESDFVDGFLFRRKQRAAEAGEAPPPDDLSGRSLTAEERAAFAAERARLMAVLDDVNRLVAPQQAADAQTAFDCWVQEFEERLEQPEMEACRLAFVAAVEALERGGGDLVVLLPPTSPDARPSAVTVRADGQSVTLDQPFAGAVGGPDGAAPTGPLPPADVARALAAAEAAEPQPFTSYTLYFETGSNAFTAASAPVFAEALQDALTRDAARVTVFGHADRVGSDAVNVRVSGLRAAAIADLLRAEGVPDAAIASDSFGDRRPLVPTADGVAEPLNRRVEIIVR